MGKISFDEAKDRIREYSYSLIYMLDGIKVNREPVSSVDWEECMEARFFGEKGELRIWRDGSDYQAAEVTQNGEYINEDYEIAKRYQDAGKKLSVRKYIDYDSDGQAFVKSTLLYNLEG